MPEERAAATLSAAHLLALAGLDRAVLVALRTKIAEDRRSGLRPTSPVLFLVDRLERGVLGVEPAPPERRAGWITAREAATIIGCSPTWVRCLARDGRIRASRDRRPLLVDELEVRAYAATFAQGFVPAFVGDSVDDSAAS
jgi:excisionase family DNA binding protein